MDTGRFRRDLTAWLDEHADELAPPFEGNGTLDEQMAQYRLVKGALWDADFGRYGWPEPVGGLGGPTMFRADRRRGDRRPANSPTRASGR